jgi:tetratricopeptide (TPR) repeat protein
MHFRWTALLCVCTAITLLGTSIWGQLKATRAAQPKVDKQSFAEVGDPAGPTTSTPELNSAAAKKDKAIELNNRGVILAREGHNEEAAILLEQAVGFDPALANAYLNLSIVYDRLDRGDDSLAAAYSALDARPDWPRARLQACQTLLYLERVSDSVSCYTKLKSLRPLNVSALEGYAAALMKSGKFSEAIPVLQQIILAQPADARARTALGTALYKKKKYGESIESFKEAVELDPAAPNPRFNLAIASLAKGDRTEALDQYRFLQTAEPDLAKELFNILFKDKLVVVRDEQ